MSAKIKVKSITITRAEGPFHLCGKTMTFSGFREARRWLWSQSSTFPKIGGYDKHDFVVTWEDNETYSGRLDCKHHTCKNNDLDVHRHVLESARFYAGHKPFHMDQELYDEFMREEEQRCPNIREEFREFISTRLEGADED
jgi:hypothetical protein